MGKPMEAANAPAVEPATTPVAQPAPVAATEAPASNLPMDLDKIDAFLKGEGTIDVGAADLAAQPAPAPVAAPVAAPAEPVTEPVATDPAPVATDPAPAAAPEPEKILPNRIGTGQFAQSTQRAIALMHELNNGKPEGQGPYTLKDCLGMVEQADAKAIGTPAQAQPSERETLAGEIASMEDQLREAGESQSLMTPEITKTISDLTTKKARLEALKATEETEQTRTLQEHVRARDAIRDQVIADYPAAKDSSTPLGARISAIIKEWSNESHPEHALLSRADAPRIVAERAANEVAEHASKLFGVSKEDALARISGKPITAAPAQPALQQPRPVAGTRQVAASPAAAPVSQAAPTEAELLARSLDDPSIADAAFGYGGRLVIGG